MNTNDMDNFSQNGWKDILDRLSAIREQEDYSQANVEFVKEQLRSEDDRVRGGAALAADGCLFEPFILDLLLQIVESDHEPAVRKASIQTLGQLIHEGVIHDFDTEQGYDTEMEYYEEWDDIQGKELQEDFLRTKNILYLLVQNDREDRQVREACLLALSDLGSREMVRDWIDDFINSEYQSSQLVALNAMGKFPQFWLTNLADFLTPETPKNLLMEAISSSYSSESVELAEKIEKLLNHPDPEILSYAILTLANINQTPELGSILQEFSLHENEIVKKAAREAIKNFTSKNFSSYLKDELGFEE